MHFHRSYRVLLAKSFFKPWKKYVDAISWDLGTGILHLIHVPRSQIGSRTWPDVCIPEGL